MMMKKMQYILTTVKKKYILYKRGFLPLYPAGISLTNQPIKLQGLDLLHVVVQSDYLNIIVARSSNQ